MTEPLPVDAMRRHAWWRAVRGYFLTPTEISLLVIVGIETGIIVART